MKRRDFLAQAALAGASMALASAGLAQVLGGEDEFDYIVVGSGAGGGPVAANLAKAGFRVLVLEAGGNYSGLNYQVPVFHGLSTEDRAMSWDFYVKHYASREARSRDSKYVAEKDGILYPRAATLGGCTAHNAMITLYPDNRDWDDIERLTGDRSWNSSAMREYYRKVEKASYLGPLAAAAASRRGLNGWLNLEQTSPFMALRDPQVKDILLAAAEEDGVLGVILENIFRQNGNIFLDPNEWAYVRRKVEGHFNIPKATKDGRRNGTRELLLRTQRERPQNLHIRTGALATQVVFDPADPTRAIGVEYMEGNSLYQADPRSSAATRGGRPRKLVRAKNEVILAGGAFNSPQLLMLSGIGDRNELEQKGVRPRVHRPGVGKNLQDRYEVGVVTELENPFALLEDCTFGQAGDPCLVEHQRRGNDSVYGSNGVLISMFRKSRPGLSDPDVCIFGLPGDFRGYAPGWSRRAISGQSFTWAILKGQTKNTAGSVGLKSADPTDTPEINFRYFGEGNDRSGEDLQDVVEAIKYVRRVNARPKFARLARRELVPGPAVRNDREISDFVTREAWGHHASCSNKMGHASDPMAVVNGDFKVHGTRNLRVVDASVFPRIPGLFIVVPIYMVAEKASESIIRDSALLGRTRRGFLGL